MPSPTCIDQTLLHRFASEELDEEQALAVELHIRECPRCAAFLERQFASLIKILQTSASPIRHTEQERIEQLIAQLEELPALVAGQEAVIAGLTQDSPETTALAESLEAGITLRPPQQPDEIGRLGTYRVLELVGAGGMGAIFRAEDPVLHREVAIKVIRRGAGSATLRQRLLREGRAIAALDHDHIVPVWQMGEEGGQPFLVMPLLRGETLGALLRRHSRVPLPLALQIARETASALAAAHTAGLVHRDLKPDNLWLEARPEGQRVRILDFGLAATPFEDGQPIRSGAVLGTPPYMAPEQAWGGPVDPRTDLFSLGCVLYECLAGHRPFAGRNQLSVLWALANHQLRPLHEVAPAVPRPVSDLVMRLLARHPQERPASASEVVSALQELSAGLPRTVLPTCVSQSAQRVRTAWLLLLGAGILGITGVLVILLWSIVKG